MNTWFRFYNEAVDDPKVQRLSPVLFRSWVNILCLCSANDGTLPSLEDVSYKLRISTDKAAYVIEELIACGLLDRIDNDIEPHNWNGRQFKSDMSRERTAKWRRKRHGDVTVTASVTDQSRADTEHIHKQKNPPITPPLRKSLKSVPESMPVTSDDRVWASKNDITVDLELETAAMMDWAHSKSIRRADWPATRRNWWRGAQRRERKDTHVDKQERNAQAARRLLSRLDSENRSSVLRGIPAGQPDRLLGTVTAIDGRTDPNGSKSHN